MRAVSQYLCRIMFLNTLGISERQVRTALAKTNAFGVTEGERRGGMQKERKQKSDEIFAAMKEHINRFPRTEAHYWRKNNRRQYLASDLTISKMYKMYKEDGENQEGSYDT